MWGEAVAAKIHGSTASFSGCLGSKLPQRAHRYGMQIGAERHTRRTGVEQDAAQEFFACMVAEMPQTFEIAARGARRFLHFNANQSAPRVFQHKVHLLLRV